MKKHLLTIVVVMFSIASQAQQTTELLWPIAGAKAGDNILYTPQSYIDKELNFDNLFIAAPLGTAVLAPSDGTISDVSLLFCTNLVYSTNFGLNETFDKAIAYFGKSKDAAKFDMKFVTGNIGLAIGDGTIIYINGLSGDKSFKTGQKINRGDTLGYVSYCYKKINEPSISITISKLSKASDPMTPFGLKTTFIPPTEIKPIVSLTKEQAKEDFSLYIKTLKDIFPGLYNIITESELVEYEKEILAKIDGLESEVPYEKFRQIMLGVMAKIHDSHIWLNNPSWQKLNSLPDYQPKLVFGLFNDSLICVNATVEYKDMLGKAVKSINGLDAAAAKAVISEYTATYDAKVESYKDYQIKNRGFGAIFRDTQYPMTFDMEIELLNGEKLSVKGTDVRRSGMPRYTNLSGLSKFLNLNRHQGWTNSKMLNDSTAYIGITTFELSQTQVDKVGEFIDSISKAKVANLIFDVRNNGGGNVEVLEKLYSYVAGEPMTVYSYGRVRSRTLKTSLSMERLEGDSLFRDYVTVEGREGFYDPATGNRIIAPDTTINYKGRLYILADENSISAATLFPSMAVRNHRGVVVGRETRTAYHFMNALKFADIRLPNSTLTITVPLVESGFDTVVNARVPFGRGLLPDYPVELTLDEINYTNGDSILNYTLRLIDEGKYLSAENPFAAANLSAVGASESAGWGGNKYWWLIGGLCAGVVLIAGVVVALRHKKS